MLQRTLEPEVMDTPEEARDYDAMDHSHVNRVFVDDLLAFAKQSGWTEERIRTADILDLGTGTALIPLQLVRQFLISGCLLAVDLSAEMLKLAIANVRAADASSIIFPLYSDAKCLSVADQSCDFVMSNSIIHHIPEPLLVFREMRRVLKPGGILFVRDLMRPDSREQVEQLVATYTVNENAHQRQMFRQSLHAALTVADVSNLLQQSGFDGASVQQNSDRHWTAATVG